jgi:hypothetical protein
MVVEESRILQVSIFNTLQNNLGRVDFGTALLDVMTIADEVDSRLKHAMLGFYGDRCRKGGEIIQRTLYAAAAHLSYVVRIAGTYSCRTTVRRE